MKPKNIGVFKVNRIVLNIPRFYIIIFGNTKKKNKIRFVSKIVSAFCKFSVVSSLRVRTTEKIVKHVKYKSSVHHFVSENGFACENWSTCVILNIILYI